jgi:hypothetical protein
MDSILKDFTLEDNFYIEVVCYTIAYFPMVVQAIIGQLLIEESQRTVALLHDLSFRCHKPSLKQTVCLKCKKFRLRNRLSRWVLVFQIERFGLFLAHHRLQVTLLGMLVLNLEIIFMVTRFERTECAAICVKSSFFY